MTSFRDFTLSDWLVHFEHRHQEEIQLGLERVTTVARRLDLCIVEPSVITVAGTNGKGSTVAALDAIYRSAGYRVASYTSPHLMQFNERIRINGLMISDEALCEAFLVIEDARRSVHLTYFEMTTLAALWYFKQSCLDLIILEVGMGGRLDATNIVDADLAIITTIDWDHQAYLGDTFDAIGYEKAGVLRAGKPCIYADKNPPASIVAHARSLNAPLYCLDVDYSFHVTPQTLQHDGVRSSLTVRTQSSVKARRPATCSRDPAILLDFQDRNGSREQVAGRRSLNSQQELEKDILCCLPLPGIHANACSSAVFATHCLQALLPVSRDVIEQAMRDVRIVGRQQWVHGEVAILYDVAHNPQSVSLLAEKMRHMKWTGRVLAVFSGLQDKDLCGLIRLMRSSVDVWYPTVLSTKRAASESLILNAFSTEGIEVGACYPHPAKAYRAALAQASPGDLIVVYGSFMTVSAIMRERGELA